MATVMFDWEQGGGLGHLMQTLPLAEGLARKGHRVFVAPRDLVAASALYDHKGVLFLPASHKEAMTGPVPCRRTLNFAHVLMNIGWDTDRSLEVLAGAWRNQFISIRPDAGVFDHGPTALLASRGLPMKRILIGSGFCCPPDTFPLPALVEGADVERLRAEERLVLDRANRLLAAWRQPPLERLGQLYSQVDENLLTTFEELEQYPGRIGGEYWGPVIGPASGIAPQWPAGEGPRVFGYLKRFKALPDLLKLLAEKACPTIAYIEGLDEKTRRQFHSPTLRIESQRLDLTRAARECDLAVLHAGQGSTAQVLLAGKPVLQVPLVLEQQLTARAVAKLGAGETASPTRPESIREKLEAMLASDRYAAAARAFARRHAGFDPAAQVGRMVSRVEELLARRNGRAGLPMPTRGMRLPPGVFRA